MFTFKFSHSLFLKIVSRKEGDTLLHKMIFRRENHTPINQLHHLKVRSHVDFSRHACSALFFLILFPTPTSSALYFLLFFWPVCSFPRYKFAIHNVYDWAVSINCKLTFPYFVYEFSFLFYFLEC